MLRSQNIYGARTPKCVRAKFDEIDSEVQKFRNPLRRVRTFKPTSKTEREILVMSIAVHLEKGTAMTYVSRTLPY